MFRRRSESQPKTSVIKPVQQVTSVLGDGTSWNGSLFGSGGVRIEGNFDGEIRLRGLLVVGESGNVTCENVRANFVIVAGLIKGNITAPKVEIRSTGRVWGDVRTAALATEEGAFLRGQITMEDEVEGLMPGYEDETNPRNVGKDKLDL